MSVQTMRAVNSYTYLYRIQYRLNKGTVLRTNYFDTRERAEAFARSLLQDEYQDWCTVELYDNQTNSKLHTYR